MQGSIYPITKNEKKQNNDKNVTILALLREGYNFIDILKLSRCPMFYQNVPS